MSALDRESPDDELDNEVDDELIGTNIDKFEVLRSIGRGGMGRVYEAINTKIGKRVAIKIIDRDLIRSRDAVTRFQREAQAASAVESAHIVQIFDSGETKDGLPYLVMEMLRGEDLGNRIKRIGRLEIPEAIDVTAQILRGLQRAHDAGIIHRDLKPDNVFLVDQDDTFDFAKILDFGISKIQPRDKKPVKTITRQGTVLGTPFYMSPEQAQAVGDVDGRSDLWSVGAILYECLCGRPPHTGGSYEQVIVNICTKDAADIRTHNPAVDEEIAAVLDKALARERESRFADAREFHNELVRAAGGQVSIKPLSSSRGATPQPRTIVRASDDPRGLTPTEEAHAPTLEAHNAPSRVGWATSGGEGRGSGWLYAMVGVAALALGVVGVLAMTGDAESSPEPEPPATDPTVMDVRLKSEVPGAVFRLDGVELAGGRLRGQPGEEKVIEVSAPDHQTKEVLVTLDPAEKELSIDLEPKAAPSASPTASVEATVEPSASAPPTPPPVAAKPPAPPRPPPGATTRSLPPPPPPTSNTGVAGGLELKTE